MTVGYLMGVKKVAMIDDRWNVEVGVD